MSAKLILRLRTVLDENHTLNNNYNSMIVRILLSTKSSKLTKTNNNNIMK